MSYTYASFVSALASNIVISSTNADFVLQLPNIIGNAERRLYRDLDLLSTVFRDTGGTVTFNSRAFTLPATYGTFNVVEGVNLFVTSARASSLQYVSREFIDTFYPADAAPSSAALPRFWTRDADQSLLIAPAPGPSSAVTGLEVVGTIFPATLSASNTTTFLSTRQPDLFMAAAMVEAAGWMKNYGAQADDPRQGLSWENRYQSMLPSAKLEENRKRFASGSWTAKFPANSQPERV